MSERDDEVDPSEVRRLRRQRMADGHEVIGGALAQEALDAVGARAMTLDRTVVVGDDFDPEDARDQALYAHEAHHRDASGGEAPHHGDHDDEERRAREVEAMVLHRRRADAPDDEADADAPGDVPGASPPASGAPDALAGYRALRAQGLDQDAVVRRLARAVVDALRAERDDHALRGERG